jgi:hypothetical protein
MLYPGLDFSKQFHEDHVFPRSRFTRTKLARAGIAADLIDDYIDRMDTLPNLQLLAGIPNTEKQATLPMEWLNDRAFQARKSAGAMSLRMTCKSSRRS